MFQKAGFRDANRNGDTDVHRAPTASPDRSPTYPAAPVLDPNSVRETLLTWNAATRATNVLIVMDVSGSMDDIVAGANRPEPAAARPEGRAGRDRPSSTTTSSVGLWEFSTNLDGQKDYKSLVPLGALTDEMHGRQRTRRDDV